MTAIYNEIEPYAVAWLRNLITAGHIAPGVVDARSIRDLAPTDLVGGGQRHFFAGIGVWSHALRLAGWPDDLDVWTGSCPCQPFSGAGARGGFDDARHLWPAWFSLIRECRPSVVFGEQVASGDGLRWLDLVHADLEGAGYAVGTADLCAASVGAPHIRQRLFFVAIADGFDGRLHLSQRMPRRTDAEVERRREARELADAVPAGRPKRRTEPGSGSPSGCGRAGELGNAGCARSGRHARTISRDEGEGEGEGLEPRRIAHEPVDAGPNCYGLGDAAGRAGNSRLRADEIREDIKRESSRPPGERDASPGGLGSRALADPDELDAFDGDESRSWRLVQPASDATSGFWGGADWIACSDGKSRPVEPGTFPLAHGATARVGRLRAYGNAIVAEVAATFIRAVIGI